MAHTMILVFNMTKHHHHIMRGHYILGDITQLPRIAIHTLTLCREEKMELLVRCYIGLKNIHSSMDFGPVGEKGLGKDFVFFSYSYDDDDDGYDDENAIFY